MPATPLTPNLIEPLMQVITMVSVGLDPTIAASAKAVRIGWQTTGQPASDITEDVIYIRCTEEDDLYNRIRDEELSDIGPEPATQLQIDTTYTRVWRTFWTLYGPGSFDKARQIRSALFKQKIHDMLLGAYGTFQLLPNPGAYANLALYLVTDIAAPTRVPENFGGQWWERVDFSCQFNEGVDETDVINAVASTEVIIENSDGVLIDEILYQGDPPPLPVPQGELELVLVKDTANPLVFSLSISPSLLQLFQGGLLQADPGDYSLNGNLVTFVVAPMGVLIAYGRP